MTTVYEGRMTYASGSRDGTGRGFVEVIEIETGVAIRVNDAKVCLTPEEAKVLGEQIHDLAYRQAERNV